MKKMTHIKNVNNMIVNKSLKKHYNQK